MNDASLGVYLDIHRLGHVAIGKIGCTWLTIDLSKGSGLGSQIGILSHGGTILILPASQCAFGRPLHGIAGHESKPRRRRTARTLSDGGIRHDQPHPVRSQAKHLRGDLQHSRMVTLPDVSSGDEERGTPNLGLPL